VDNGLELRLRTLPMEASTISRVNESDWPSARDARNTEPVAVKSEAVCTDGVVALRVWEPEDAQWYAGSVQDHDIQRFTTEPPTLTAEEVRTAIITLRSAEPRSDGSLPDVGLLICDATTGDRLGNIAFAGREAELSYWIAAPARGRGVATRAVRLLADYAFDVLNADELRLWTRSDNAASEAVAEHAGFVRDPSEDRQRQVKGRTWDMRGYVRRRQLLFDGA
jgi:RimJ/RimL family protein N-acetyltransferase